MNEPRTIEERYATASTTSHLIVDSEHKECDVLVAAGMAGQKHRLALALWSFAHMPTITRLHTLRTEVERMVNRRLDTTGSKGDARSITKAVLSWWANPACPHCSGRGYEKYHNAPALSDVLCGHCDGSGKRKVQCENQQVADWAVAELERLAAQAATHIKHRLY